VVVGKTLSFATDFYQPIDPEARFFVQPELFVGARNANVYEGDTRIAETRVSELTAGLRAGVNINDGLTLAGSVNRGIGRVTKKTGTAELGKSSFDTATLRAALAYDTLDNIKFPKDGAFVTASYLYSPEELGATYRYQASTLSFNKAFSFGRHSLIASQVASFSWDGEPGISDLFQLGGPFKLSGLSYNSLSGTQALFSRLIYFYELTRLNPIFLDLPIYSGFTFEYGDVFQKFRDIDLTTMRSGGNVFLGADTFLGPVYLGAGLTEGGDRAVFLSIGDLF
jgi:NTE family protein